MRPQHRRHAPNHGVLPTHCPMCGQRLLKHRGRIGHVFGVLISLTVLGTLFFAVSLGAAWVLDKIYNALF